MWETFFIVFILGSYPGILPGLLSLRFCEIQTIKCEKKNHSFRTKCENKKTSSFDKLNTKTMYIEAFIIAKFRKSFRKIYSRKPFFCFISDGVLWNGYLQWPTIFHVTLRNRQKSVNTLAGWLRTIDNNTRIPAIR